MRALKFIAGILLLPLCAAESRALLELLLILSQRGEGNTAALWFAGGFLFWVILFLALPRPTRTYILAHELTHALWTWLLGGEVYRMRVGRSSGSVLVSVDNLLVSLAPYFFPLYTVLVIIAWYILSLFWDLSAYQPFWMAAVGVSWSFHVTFTLDLLRRRQPDIVAHGRLFSYTVIYLLNLLGLGLWIVIVSRLTLPDLLGALRNAAVACYGDVVKAAYAGIRRWMPVP